MRNQQREKLRRGARRPHLSRNQDEELRGLTGLDGIDPSLTLLSPQGDLGPVSDGAMAPVIPGYMFHDPRSVYEQMNRHMMNEDRNPPPWVPGMGLPQSPNTGYGQYSPDINIQSGPSIDTHSRVGDQSLFSMQSTENTSMTTAEPLFQHAGLPNNLWVPNSEEQVQRRESQVPGGHLNMSYAAIVRGDASRPPYSRNRRQTSVFGVHLTVPETNVYQPQVPHSAPSARSDISVTPAHMPEVLLCEKGGCRATFKGAYRRGNLRRHMRLRHEADVVYPCDMCGKAFKRSDARLKHMRKDHEGSVPAAVPRPTARPPLQVVNRQLPRTPDLFLFAK